PELSRDRVGDARMRVSNVRHIVVRVDVRSPRLVEQVLHPASHDVEGMRGVRELDVGAEKALTGAQQGSRRRSLSQTFRWNAENQVRIGTQTEPGLALTCRRDTIEVAGHVEQVRDDLKVEMWPPVAVYRRRPDGADLLTGRHAPAHDNAFE